jgi:hypothetical protein
MGARRELQARNAPAVYTNESGELQPSELMLRLGLLLGAGLFFNESLGLPWNRNLFGIAACFVSALIVSTLAFQWRVLGDWRRRTQQVLLAGLFLVLSFPIAAALSPTFGASAIPDFLEGPLSEIIHVARKVPGIPVVIGFLKAMISFIFLALVLIILVMTNSAARRGGLIFVALLNASICLFFYPRLETFVGLVFVALFLHRQWEIPLLISDRVRAHLARPQVEFLRELIRQGSLTTGETRVYLANRPEYFAELLDFQLVEYDPTSRDVVAGRKLGHDASTAVAEKAFGYGRRFVWLMIGLVYFIMPDFLPGPIDDAVVIALCVLSGFNFVKLWGPND